METETYIVDEDKVFETEVPREWHNRQRVLLACARGLTMRERSLTKDLLRLLPHCKGDSKLEKKGIKSQLQFSCSSKSADNFLYLEKRGERLMLYIGKQPNGPTFRFAVHKVVPMTDFKFGGNGLRHSRPLLSFCPQFETQGILKLLRYNLVDIFNTPKAHPKSQPFTDRVISFSVDPQNPAFILFRHFQILRNSKEETELVEIGPRMNLEIASVVEGFLDGSLLYENPLYMTRREAKAIRKQEENTRRKTKEDDKQERLKRKERIDINEEESSMDEFGEA